MQGCHDWSNIRAIASGIGYCPLVPTPGTWTWYQEVGSWKSVDLSGFEIGCLKTSNEEDYFLVYLWESHLEHRTCAYHHPQVNMVQACAGKEKPPRSTSRRLPRQDTPRKRQAATQKSAGISSRQVEGKCASVVELCARHGQHAKRDRRAWGSKTEA